MHPPWVQLAGCWVGGRTHGDYRWCRAVSRGSAFVWVCCCARVTDVAATVVLCALLVVCRCVRIGVKGLLTRRTLSITLECVCCCCHLLVWFGGCTRLCCNQEGSGVFSCWTSSRVCATACRRTLHRSTSSGCCPSCAWLRVSLCRILRSPVACTSAASLLHAPV